jgi:quinoprotein glucose dehydrogenase
MTYSYRGRQYVVIAAGGHSTLGSRAGDSIVAFALTSAEASFAIDHFQRLASRQLRQLTCHGSRRIDATRLGIGVWNTRAAPNRSLCAGRTRSTASDGSIQSN